MFGAAALFVFWERLSLFSWGIYDWVSKHQSIIAGCGNMICWSSWTGALQMRSKCGGNADGFQIAQDHERHLQLVASDFVFFFVMCLFLLASLVDLLLFYSI